MRSAEQVGSRDATHRRRSVGPRLLLRLRIRRAVTLVELLITVTIIAILSATFLGAGRAAMETARVARTKTTIAKLHGLLMERWASYATRRVDVNIPTGTPGRATADIRLLALREMMKLEMPDRWSDIVGNSVDVLPPSTTVTQNFQTPKMLPSRPALTSAYLRRYSRLTTDDVETIQRNQGAECLYMIIMLATGDGEARTLFNQRDIGDTDGDGAPEFLDGWGRPILFIRWPAGFISDLQPVDPVSKNRLADQDHDPFDYFRRDQEGVPSLALGIYPTRYQQPVAGLRQRNNNLLISAYRLVPLIYSAGADGDSDVLVDTGAVPSLRSWADPYALIYGPNNDLQLGTAIDLDDPPDGNGSLDNIHNHLLDGR